MRYNRTSALYDIAKYESKYSTAPQPIEIAIDNMKEFEIINYLLRGNFDEQETKNENIS
jgi:hypothetical protein